MYDSYDGGNYLHVAASGYRAYLALTYTECPEQGGPLTSAGYGDVMYATCKTPGLFAAVFTSMSAALERIKVTGELEADGLGMATGNIKPLVSTGGGFNGWYKTVFD